MLKVETCFLIIVGRPYCPVLCKKYSFVMICVKDMFCVLSINFGHFQTLILDSDFNVAIA